MNTNRAYLLVNFGGPRDVGEIAPFLTALLQDRDVIRTRFPTFFHNWFFGRIARKRAGKIAEDYEKIGGRSPIYFDTEETAKQLSPLLNAPVLTFHRYLPATHANSLSAIEECAAKEIQVIPLFPQFSYATTGSIARFFMERLEPKQVRKLRWIKSYPAHRAFIGSYIQRISDFLREKNLNEEETILLFSAHGVPLSFIERGDLYQSECELSYLHTIDAFPKALGRLSYQSKFGRGEWLRPYTDETCKGTAEWGMGRKQVVVVPIAFTSDHIETLFEIEELYLPLIRQQGFDAYRCPALNLEPYWIEGLCQIAKETSGLATQMLVRTCEI